MGRLEPLWSQTVPVLAGTTCSCVRVKASAMSELCCTLPIDAPNADAMWSALFGYYWNLTTNAYCTWLTLITQLHQEEAMSVIEID